MPYLPDPRRADRTPSRGWSAAYFLPALLAITAVLVALVVSDGERRTQHHLAQRTKAAEQLADVAARLETNIRGNVNLVHGLVTVVANEPKLTQPRFSAIAQRIFAVPSQLRNVATAPDFVVQMVYPEEVNRATIGLDYMKTPGQREAVLQVVERRKVIITGPVNLVQGGQGLVARYPVFSISSGRFSGIVSAVIDLERLYRDSNVTTPSQTLDIAIARRPTPHAGDVFLGSEGVFWNEPVTLSIDLGYDTWYLAATPKGGWLTESPGLTRFRLLGLAIACCIAAPLAWAGFLMKQRHRSIIMLQEREERLDTLSQRLQLALEASKIGVWEYDPETNRFFWDSRMCDLYGATLEKGECQFEDWLGAIHPEDLQDAEAAFGRALQQEDDYLQDFRIILPTGDIRHIRAHGAVHKTSTGAIRLVGANWDVSDDVTLQTELRSARAETEEQNRQLRTTRRILEHQSLHDALTGLPNRRFLDQFMVTADTSDVSQKLAFIHIDLDRFKHVNDTLGHGAGDEVLKTVTARLRDIVGPEEVISRIGGDEFVIVTCGADPASRAQDVAQAVVATLSRPIHLDGQECRIGCSAGIALQATAAETPQQLLINADIALYEAKKRGRNRFEFFSDELRSATVETKRTADEFLKALECDEFVPFFQPQFDAHSFAITGVEALARWDHPHRGILTPDKFLNVAEGLGRVAEIDALVLEKSLFQMTRWRIGGVSIPKLSVNISAQRLKDPELMAVLETLPFGAHRIAFELLESISFEDQDEELKAAIRELKERGIEVEIDDFGSGHASIVSLLQLAPKRLKIDRQLVAPMDVSESQRRLVASIIEIGRSLGIGIVAEGVETMAHAEILRDLGCHTLQGYAFANPMPAGELMAFASEWQERYPMAATNLRAG
ncbi:EAL domain-containing protein [Neorhizobium sp. T786]|uniref:bifunctional diguanylate cyclase/phosphodiesterase n=1 Tax=Pseudorhizobium xiangyangii TaxID=2883104 RepID=UPI001CFFC9C3|nr:EAL domain-containing protein [Neorhizobium xiangyangii]MCB5202374.1 EAL domain-containing protein [Neorhizobium xiangyangii]